MYTKGMIPTAVIYESPDGGHTVYRREAGSSHRELYAVSPERQSLMGDLERNKLWTEIHRDAKIDAVLQNMLDKIEIYHRLKNSP